MKHCVRCNAFLTTDQHNSVHNFFKHHDEGRDIPFEDKPIEILRFPRLTIYSNFKKHKDFYDFFNSEIVDDDFLRNVKYKFKPGGKKWIKGSFTVENIQNLPYQDLKPITNSRYWTTLPYEGMYFSNFIFYGLNILGRVVINSMSGSHDTSRILFLYR